MNFSPFTYIVNSITESGAGFTKTQDFKYNGFVSNVQGLGFLGPKEHKRSSWYDSSVTKIWSISQHDINKRGAVLNQYTSLSDVDFQTNFISKTQTTYNTTLGANKVFTNLPTQSIQTDALQGITTTTNLLYDAFNNAKESTTTFNGGSKKTVFTFSNQTATLNYTYHVGRPLSKIETSTLNNQSFVTTEEYTYHTGNYNNLLKDVKKKGMNTNWVTESFEYDTFGNVKTKTLSAPDIANRTESFTYDTSGRFLAKKTDIEGLITQYNYNTIYGYLISEINPYGLTTSYQYDGWGRMTKSTDYLGNITNYSIQALPNGGILKTVDYPNGADTVTEYNAFGWEMNSKVLSLNNKWVKNTITYDVLGRKIAVSEPYFETETPTLWTTTLFDVYGRMTKITEPTGKITTTQYNGLTTTVNDGVKTISTTKDAAGNVVSMTDPGGTIVYTYHPNGTMKTANYGGRIVSTEIDGWGRKSGLNDPDAGYYQYQYNDIGEILAEDTPKGSTYFIYDNFGKILEKYITGVDTEITTTYQYDPTTKLLNSINGTSYLDNLSKTQTIVYDSYKRISEVTESAASQGTVYNKKNYYDSLGRINKTDYTTTIEGQTALVKLLNSFDSAGNLIEIRDNQTGQLLWKKNTENARGQSLSITLGNGVTKTKTYDTFGFINSLNDSKNTESILSFNYGFNSQRGLLGYRSNGSPNMASTETFTYDSQERLSGISSTYGNFTQNYDDRGRITNNTTVGDYNYVGNNYQLKDINLNASGTSYYQNHALQEAVFNAFKKPVSIKEEGFGKMYFEYDPITLERTATYFGSNDVALKTNTQYKKYFSSIIPVEITKNNTTGEIKIITFVGGDAYSAPVMHIKRTGAAPLNTFFYLHRDYLGSILAISDSNGNAVERRQFGAWGTVDKFWNNQGATTFNFNTTLLDRGYTGHEHLFFVSLINMNGRLYDAKLGRFLSPDNFVQDPFNTQNFNRYGYVVNNPLSYTDESGEFILAAILIGAFTNIFMQAAAGNINSIGDFFLAGAIGAASGFLGAGVASLAAGGTFLSGAVAFGFTQGAFAGAAAGLASGFVGGAGNAWMNGASFGDGLMAGLKAGVSGMFIGAAVGGVAGGIKAHKEGLGFWDGNGTIDEVSDNLQVQNSTNSSGVEYSNESIENFVDECPELNRLRTNVDNLHADGSIPSGYKNENGYLYNKQNKPINGVTEYKGWFKKTINVYLSKSAFISRPQLYMTTHHEFMHAYFYANYPNIEDDHTIIHQWHYDQMKAWPGPVYINNSGYYNKDWSFIINLYSKYGFKVINYYP